MPLLDGNDIALRELLLCGLRQRDLQDAVFELCTDILRLQTLADVEAAAHRARVALLPDVAALLVGIVLVGISAALQMMKKKKAAVA